MPLSLYSGEVQKGYQRGRTINFPTANIWIGPGLPEPEDGVYVGWCCLGGEVYRAVVSYGRNPTFGNQAPTLEAHLLHAFSEDFYGERMIVGLAEKLRGLKRFSGLQELRENIASDVEQAEKYFRAGGTAEQEAGEELRAAWKEKGRSE